MHSKHSSCLAYDHKVPHLTQITSDMDVSWSCRRWLELPPVAALPPVAEAKCTGGARRWLRCRRWLELNLVLRTLSRQVLEPNGYGQNLMI